jgi:hypothetical protein
VISARIGRRTVVGGWSREKHEILSEKKPLKSKKGPEAWLKEVKACLASARP